MPMATSTPPEPGLSSTSDREHGPRSSIAIHKGADLLLELFNEEKSQLLVYREHLEKRFNEFKAQAEAKMSSSDPQLAKKTALLSTQYDKSLHDLELTWNELQNVRAEYAKLMASIEDVGLVYMDGTLYFNDTTAKVVSDFQQGAELSGMVTNSNLDTTTGARSNPIKPSDFFAFLSDVMTKGQWTYTRSLQTRQQYQNGALSEGNTSTNDKLATLQDSNFEQGSFPVWPGTY